MKEYSFLNTIVLINGFEITGWAEGDDVIQIERLADSAAHSIGADGEMTVSLSADRSGIFRMNLQQSSESNAQLAALLAAQESGSFVPIFAQFKDTGGNDLASGTQGYIPRLANLARGTGVNSQEWTVIVERLDMLLGGSGNI